MRRYTPEQFELMRSLFNAIEDLTNTNRVETVLEIIWRYEGGRAEQIEKYKSLLKDQIDYTVRADFKLRNPDRD